MISPVSPQNSDSANLNQVNNIIRELNNREKVQVFKDDTGTRRVLLGKGKDGFYGVKVSQEGKDVYDAADDELVLNSDNNLFKIVGTGTIDVPVVTPTLFSTNTYLGQVIVEKEHGLDFTPAVLAFTEADSGNTYTQVPYTFASAGGTGGGIGIYTLRVATNSTHVRAFAEVTEYGTYFGNAGGAVLASAKRVRYYLLRETVS